MKLRSAVEIGKGLRLCPRTLTSETARLGLSPLYHRDKMPVDTPQLDHLGVVYIVLAAFWTTVLLAGSAALWRLRHHESIRKRKTGLTIAAVLILQIYWCSNMVIYPLNGAYPCSINYWVMSIYFPVGIALFALHNVQLLSISARQRDLRHHPFRRSDRLTLDHLKFWRYRSSWDHMTLLSQIYFGISVCIVVQVSLGIQYLPTRA